ncbi:MAG: tetratricopeptide repeat protein [Planctomycetales bacterium]
MGWLLAPFSPAHPQEGTLDESTATYFRGLRERRLFRLAEGYCHQRLSRSNLSPALRAELTLELARTLTEHGAHASEQEQSDLWNQARTTLRDFLETNPDHPRRILLEVQQALIPALSGEWFRWQAELLPEEDSLRERAVADLDESLRQLAALEERISAEVRRGASVRTVAGGLLPAEWKALGQSVRLQTGLARLHQAHLFPAASAERAALLLEVQKGLRPLADSVVDEDLSWNARLGLVECTRLMNDAPRVLRELGILEKRNPPREFADRLLAQRLRILMSQRKSTEVALLLEERERQHGPLSGELGFLRVQSLAEQGRGRETGIPAELLETLDQSRARLRREVGGYWSYRADLIVEQAREHSQYGPELAALHRRAQGEFRRGQLAQAAELFGKAAQEAHRAGRFDLAFQWGFTRASIEVETRQWSAAADDLLELAEEFPDHKKAADAHLLGAYALGKLHESEPTAAHWQQAVQALDEHRAAYPERETWGEATWMLGELQERGGQFEAALKAYREVPRQHPRSGPALAAAARCYERALEQSPHSGPEATGQAQRAINDLTRWLPEGNSDKPLDRWQSEGAVRLARILLRRQPPEYRTADAWALRVLSSLATPAAPEGTSPPPPEDPRRNELRVQALQLRIVALAGQQKFPEARRLLDQASLAGTADLLRVLEGIVPLSANDEQDPFHDLGELQLQTALKLNEQRDQLEPRDRLRLDDCLARGYAATGNLRRAIEIHESLHQTSPKDKRLLTALGEILMRCGDKPCLRRALEAWRKLEKLSAAGSEEWLAARYELCRTLVLLEETADAAKLLKVTRLLYPKLGGEPLQRKFADLEAQCRSPARSSSPR